MRGRPRKKPIPDDLVKMAKMLINAPKEVKMTPSQEREAKLSIESMEKAQQDLFNSYRHSPGVTLEHALDMESIGDLEDCHSNLRDQIIKRDKELKNAANAYRKEGTLNNKNAAKERAEDYLKKYKLTMQKLQAGKYTINQAAAEIHNAIKDTEEDRKSIRTITRYIKNFLGQVGQG